MTTEYGVLSRYKNGNTHIAGGFTLESAERMVATAAYAKCWHPAAECVVSREVGEWVPVVVSSRVAAES